MLLCLQIILYCLLFFLLVKLEAKGNGMNVLYFYPKEYIEEAAKRGLADKDATMKRGKRFMVPFLLIILVVLVLILGAWNRVADFKTAYGQAYLFLIAMNWFDGIAMDRVWVAHSKIWGIPGMEGVPYIKSWKTVLVKRTAATVLYLVIALPIAGAALLVSGLF